MLMAVQQIGQLSPARWTIIARRSAAGRTVGQLRDYTWPPHQPSLAVQCTVCGRHLVIMTTTHLHVYCPSFRTETKSGTKLGHGRDCRVVAGVTATCDW